MKYIVSRTSLACTHAASLQMKLAVARWQGSADLMPQSVWQRDVQDKITEWLRAGGFATRTPKSREAQTKTAAKGRRSLVSQRDSDEEFQFTLIRIHDTAE